MALDINHVQVSHTPISAAIRYFETFHYSCNEWEIMTVQISMESSHRSYFSFQIANDEAERNVRLNDKDMRKTKKKKEKNEEAYLLSSGFDLNHGSTDSCMGGTKI